MGKRDEVKSTDWAKYYQRGGLKYMFMRIYEDPRNRFWSTKTSHDHFFASDTPREEKKAIPFEATATYRFFGRNYTSTSSRSENRAEEYVILEVLKKNFDIDVIKDYEKLVSEELATTNWAEAKANNSFVMTFEDICGKHIWDDLRDHKEYTFEYNGKSQKLSLPTTPISKADFITNFLNNLLDTDIEKEAQKIIKEREEKQKAEEAKKKAEEDKKLEELSKHLGTPFFAKATRYLKTLPKKDVLELMIKYPQFRESITTAIAKGMPDSVYTDYLIENNGDKLWELWSSADRRGFGPSLFIRKIPEFSLIENLNREEIKELQQSLNHCCSKLRRAQRDLVIQRETEEVRNNEKFTVIDKDLSDKDHTQFILENNKGQAFKLNIDYDDENYIGWLPSADEKPAKHLRVRYEKIGGNEKYTHEASLDMETYNRAPQALDKLFLSNLKTLIRDRAFHPYHDIPYRAIRLQSLLRTAITSEGVRKKQIRKPIEKGR